MRNPRPFGIAQEPGLQGWPYHRRMATEQQGFSLVENLMGILVLTVTVMAAAAIFAGTSQQFRSSSSINELQSIVETDLAYLREANERLTCASGSCSLASSNTNKDSYFPAVNASGALTSAQQTNLNYFISLCTNTTADGGFAKQLNDLLATPNSRIARTMTREATAHRYTVTYTDASTSRFLRQITLVPTTVAWCPTTACNSSGTCQP